jgi:hypothetical protein
VNLQIVRGDATPEEIAALVAVLTAHAARAGRTAVAARPGTAESSAAGSWRRRTARTAAWADRSRGLRAPLPHGPGAWRSSARPG